jgi:hypothetical protein
MLAKWPKIFCDPFANIKINTRGTAVSIGIKNISKGMVIKDSPNLKVERTKVAINTIAKM